MTDGEFRADGTSVPLPLHDVTTLAEAFRRTVLRLFVRRELMDVETAQGMLAWPHSGFHVHDGVWVAAADREFAVRLARYCARNRVALSRLEYQSDDATVTYHRETRKLSRDDGPRSVTWPFMKRPAFEDPSGCAPWANEKKPEGPKDPPTLRRSELATRFALGCPT